MNKFSFKYPDQDGILTERIILDPVVSKYYEGQIDAIYASDQKLRSFKLTKIQNLIDLSTGEFILNPWIHFGLNVTIQDRLDSETLFSVSAIKTLKFFAITTRGFGARERIRIQQFIRETCNVGSFSDVEIDNWLKSLWAIDRYEWQIGKTEQYQMLLNSIPMNLRNRCRHYACWIASGSGRKQIDKNLLKRIDLEFSDNPKVQKLKIIDEHF